MLKKLYQLQQLELAITALDTERVNSDEYCQLRNIRKSFEADKQKLAESNTAIARIEGKIASVDKRLADLESRIAKEKKAIYDGSVTNTRELNARQGQLESLSEKLEIAQNEKGEHQKQLAKRQDEVEKLRRTLADMQSEFSRIRDIYQVKQEERDERGRQLATEKEALVSQIDADSLAWYEKTRQRFAGTPVACLNKQRICSGCHTMLPLTAYKRAAAGQRILCENCGRTLFVED